MSNKINRKYSNPFWDGYIVIAFPKEVGHYDEILEQLIGQNRDPKGEINEQ